MITDDIITKALEQVSTPAYVYDSNIMDEQLTTLRSALPTDAHILYSLKANPHPDVVKHFVDQGCYMDVTSHHEAQVVLEAGCAPDKVLFLGPGKSRQELQFCIDNKLGFVVVESLEELSILSDMATAAGHNVGVLIRVNPSFESKNSRLSMGGKPRQFGVDQEILEASSPADVHLPGVTILGFHCYMGTRNLSAKSIAENTEESLRTFSKLATILDVDQKFADVGGGFGVPYFDKEEPLCVESLTVEMREATAEFSEQHPECELMFESGRYLIADAGAYLTSVRYRKESRGTTFLVCDGGTNHHMAAVGIGSFVKRNFPARVLNKSENPTLVDVCGPLCTPNDTLLRKIELANPQVGDVIVVERSGAYGSSASPVNFLGHGQPDEILL